MMAAADAAAQRTLLSLFTFQNGGSNIGSVVRISYTFASGATLQTANASISTGNWMYLLIQHGGSGAFATAGSTVSSGVAAGVAAYNTPILSLNGFSGAGWGAGSLLAGFAIRIS
jgi:hypothetical protein